MVKAEVEQVRMALLMRSQSYLSYDHVHDRTEGHAQLWRSGPCCYSEASSRVYEVVSSR